MKNYPKAGMGPEASDAAGSAVATPSDTNGELSNSVAIEEINSGSQSHQHMPENGAGAAYDEKEMETLHDKMFDEAEREAQNRIMNQKEKIYKNKRETNRAWTKLSLEIFKENKKKLAPGIAENLQKYMEDYVEKAKKKKDSEYHFLDYLNEEAEKRDNSDDTEDDDDSDDNCIPPFWPSVSEINVIIGMK